jgi:catechol 2,3-dioxygenase-like lactoylglutathione lyase family enzyme
VHLRDRRGGPRGRVDDLLVAGGWRLAGDQGPGDPVDRLPQHARSAQTRLADGDGSIDQPRLDIPAGEVAGGAQPLEVAPPPLANGGAEGEAEPPGPEDEAELLRRQVAVGCCICVHVTSITCDVTGDEVVRSDRGRVEELLLGWGAGRLAHPGGTLYEHLRRVASLLEAWSADSVVLMAGLCHACYGTDGYDQALLGVDDRAILVELIGWRAESLVYLYGSCDRAMAAEHGAGLLRLFTRSRERLSDAAWRACVQALGPHGPGRHDERAPIEVARLDHFVLTVTDQQRTVEFYRRVLGMQPVTFGQGRLALAFGSSKINLHQAGREFTPHAARPAPGSADICLVTTTPIDQVLAHLRLQRVAVEEGPVPRTGALGPMESVYIRDPDGNLIEIASYGAAAAGP